MVLLPEDPVTKCRQIDNNVQQLIPCLPKPGCNSMKDHMKKCELWQEHVRCLLKGRTPTKSGSPDINTNAPLYPDRRYKFKPDGSHYHSKKAKKDLENQRAKRKRQACDRILQKIEENWDFMEPSLATIGLTKADFPLKGGGFMFPETSPEAKAETGVVQNPSEAELENNGGGVI